MPRAMLIADLRTPARADMGWLGGFNSPVAYTRRGRLGVVRIDGPIGGYFGNGSGLAVAALTAATADAKAGLITEALLDLNCPGGEVEGSSDLIDAVAALGKAAPLYGIAHDDCCSLAYWAACQCRELVATTSARVGSIGTASMVLDDSERMKREGLRVVHLQTGDLKQIGMPGQPVTADQEAHLRDFIDDCQEGFASAVLVHRGIDREAIAGMRGAYFRPQKAHELGLIDRIVNFAEYLAEREASANGTGDPSMSKTTAATTAAAPAASVVATITATPAPAPAVACNDYDAMTDAEVEAEEAKIAAAKSKRAAAKAPPEEKKPEEAAAPAAVAPVAATIAELNEHIPDKAFAFDCAAKGLTLVAALSAFAKRPAPKQTATVTAAPQYERSGAAAPGTPGADDTFEVHVRAVAKTDPHKSKKYAGRPFAIESAAAACSKDPALQAQYADWLNRGSPLIKAA